MHEWVPVARTQGVPDGELAAATLDGVRIVVANAGAEYKAVADVCTHAGCSLADDGELEGDGVTCSVTGACSISAPGRRSGPPQRSRSPSTAFASRATRSRSPARWGSRHLSATAARASQNSSS
jgi:nitrite reductase/ring-hydroxylating ferredoxin subunit